MPTDVPVLWEDEHLLGRRQARGTCRCTPQPGTTRTRSSRCSKRSAPRSGSRSGTGSIGRRAASSSSRRARRATAFLKRAFEARAGIEKTYLAVTWGVPDTSRSEGGHERAFRYEQSVELDPTHRTNVKMRLGEVGSTTALYAATRFAIEGERTSPSGRTRTRACAATSRRGASTRSASTSRRSARRSSGTSSMVPTRRASREARTASLTDADLVLPRAAAPRALHAHRFDALASDHGRAAGARSAVSDGAGGVLGFARVRALRARGRARPRPFGPAPREKPGAQKAHEALDRHDALLFVKRRARPPARSALVPADQTAQRVTADGGVEAHASASSGSDRRRRAASPRAAAVSPRRFAVVASTKRAKASAAGRPSDRSCCAHREAAARCSPFGRRPRAPTRDARLARGQKAIKTRTDCTDSSSERFSAARWNARARVRRFRALTAIEIEHHRRHQPVHVLKLKSVPSESAASVSSTSFCASSPSSCASGRSAPSPSCAR